MGVGAGGRVAECPPRLLTGKFLLTYQEKRGKEKRKNEAEKKENWESGKFKVTKWGEDLFFFFFFFCAFPFWKPLKFVLGLPKMEFSTRKKHYALGKKSGIMTLPPLKNIPLTSLTKMMYFNRYFSWNTEDLKIKIKYTMLFNKISLITHFLLLKICIHLPSPAWNSRFLVISPCYTCKR